jgi:hypothetical protein
MKMSSWIVLIAVISIAAGIAQTHRGQGLLHAAGLSPPSGSYTALSFANPQTLPTRLGSKVAPIHISFVIRNASASSGPRAYHWVILLSHAGRSRAAAAGQVLVSSGAKTTVNKTVFTSCTRGRLKLAVHLAYPAESIDFRAACWSPNRRTREDPVR